MSDGTSTQCHVGTNKKIGLTKDYSILQELNHVGLGCSLLFEPRPWDGSHVDFSLVDGPVGSSFQMVQCSEAQQPAV